ncbi:MAG: nicotinate-nicotinamide nucleotide adenylyltransferase, partial [Sarcina sp.]
MKKIGVLGGTFDPIHNGHLYIAYEAYRKLKLDEVIFMPTGTPPHKLDKKVTNEKIRYSMVKKAILPYSFFTISDY